MNAGDSYNEPGAIDCYVCILCVLLSFLIIISALRGLVF